jgi:hypothetical protein
MSSRLIWWFVWMVVFQIASPSSYAADSTEVTRLKQEVAEALAGLTDVCREAWQYDNLRPTIARAVWPEGTLFHPPQIPVVHLSAGSPYYRAVVGQMAYWGSLSASRIQRLVDFTAGRKVPPPQGKAVLMNGSSVEEEIPGAEKELDHAKASYRRACAWAWPFANLRPLCHQPGLEPATIINPFIPVPDGGIALAPTNPDYPLIVAALHDWEPRIPPASVRLKDLLDDRQAAAEAAAVAAGHQGNLPAPADDPRLARMFDILQQLKPVLQQWRADQRELDSLIMPWGLASGTLAALQFQAQQLQNELAVLAIRANDPRENQALIWQEAQNRQTQLAALAPQIAQAQYTLDKIESRIKELRKEQVRLAQQADASMNAWVHLCDVLGRLGRAAHQKALPLFDQWIADEPRLWQPYLARAAARLHTGRHEQALDDLRRVGNKLQFYDSRPEVLAFFTAIQGYALCKQKDTRNGEALFASAKKIDKILAATHFFHAWSNIERGDYSKAKADLRLAYQLSKNAPQAEVFEAIALLLAASPMNALRNGQKAVDNAIMACRLTKGNDWICLDTLGTAYAEAGDFPSALKWANKALASAPAESQEPIRDHIALYQVKKPYRLK